MSDVHKIGDAGKWMFPHVKTKTNISTTRISAVSNNIKRNVVLMQPLKLYSYANPDLNLGLTEEEWKATIEIEAIGEVVGKVVKNVQNEKYFT